MDSDKLYKIEEVIGLRRELHRHAEPSFEEFETAKRIRAFLMKKGVTEECITDCYKPGFYVDIMGKGDEVEQAKTIAFRAEMDALIMKENNPDLPYASITNSAHMCGHDGHMAGLIGGIVKTLNNINNIPKNIRLRFIFQIAEETVSGAQKMALEGCLEGVSEVWGLHNIPSDPINAIYVKPGVLTAGSIILKLNIKGKGGHSSLKGQLKNPILARSQLNVWVEEMLLKDFKEENEKLFTVCFPGMNETKAYNVIPDECFLGGSIRFFDKEAARRVYCKIEECVKRVEEKYGVEIDMSPSKEKLFLYDEVDTGTHPVINDEALTKALIDLVPTHYTDDLPKKFCEDFSEFANRVPGCFFLYATGNNGKILHQDNYNFNEDCLDNIACLWSKIINDRANK